MKRLLLIAFGISAVARATMAAAPLNVQLTFSPSETLPALPVSARLSITNISTTPVAVSSQVSVTATDASGVARKGWFTLPPQVWASEPSAPATLTIAPGATVDRLMPVDEFLAYAPMFLVEDLGLWRPGQYSIGITVASNQGEEVGVSNAPLLNVVLPGAADMTVWRTYSQEGTQPFVSATLLHNFDVIQANPTSDYYRRLAPFTRNAPVWPNPDLDRHATTLIQAVQGLPGAFLDAARLSITMRYRDEASGASANGNQIAAGELSSKGRVHAQQLIDNPATPFGATIGTGLKASLKTTEQWQAYFNTGRPGAPGAQRIRPFVACSKSTGNQLTVTFGYENPNSNPVTIAIDEKNKFVPAPDGRGQPTTFLSGRHAEAITLQIDGKKNDASRKISWVLDGTTANAPAENDPKCK